MERGGVPPTPIRIILYDETKIVNKFKVETKNDCLQIRLDLQQKIH